VSTVAVDNITNEAGTGGPTLPNGIAGGLTLGGDLTLDTNGIYLGGTGSANYLDDYEEGTWTPAVYATISASGVTYSSNNVGFYTKVGRMVTVSALLQVSDKGTLSGAIGISGFPFNSLSDNGGRGGAAIGYSNGINVDDFGFMLNNPSSLGVFRILNGPDLTTSNFSTSFSIYFSYTYMTS